MATYAPPLPVLRVPAPPPQPSTVYYKLATTRALAVAAIVDSGVLEDLREAAEGSLLFSVGEVLRLAILFSRLKECSLRALKSEAAIDVLVLDETIILVLETIIWPALHRLEGPTTEGIGAQLGKALEVLSVAQVNIQLYNKYTS